MGHYNIFEHISMCWIGFTQKVLKYRSFSDSKVHGANVGPTWVLSAPGGSHVGPLNLAIWGFSLISEYDVGMFPAVIHASHIIQQ